MLAEQLVRTGNPSSLHASGRAARRVVEEARERLAAALGARPSEVVWTAGGTEADNLAVKGLFWARRDAGPRRRRDAGVRRRAPRGAGPGVLDGRARGRRAGRCCRSTPTGCWTSTRCTRSWSARRRGRADLRDVGEQRGRCPAAARRRGRARAPVRRARARRRGAGRRARCRSTSAASGLDALTRQRAQGGRTGRRRRAAGAARARADARAARRRAGARRAVGHARRRAARVVRAGRRAVGRAAARSSPRAWGRCATRWSRASGVGPRRGAARPRAPAAAARQRPLHVPRLRGRLAALPARLRR